MLYEITVRFFNYGVDVPMHSEAHLSIIGEENARRRAEEFLKAENLVGLWLVDFATGELLYEFEY